MDVIGYARVVPQEGGDEALQHQRDRIESYCKAKQYNLVGFYQEQVSRDIALDERKVLLEAMAASKGKALLIVRLNKISGQKSMVREAVRRITEGGGQLLTVEGSNDPETMESTLQVTMKRE
ncbi:MAG: recombinase family protein [Candidatus Obscuribacterales bacterium]|nr:recombinase family protein [Candidatus Obscuribacterales bacterium]